MKSFRKFLIEDSDQFEDLKQLVTLVARGVRRALFVYGSGGTGKTFIVTETIKNLGLRQNKDWYIFSGKASIFSLYKQLFLLRKDKLLVLDDFDDAFNHPDSAALLKAALDTQTRTLNWFSTHTTNVTSMSEKEKEEYNKKIEQQLRDNPQDQSIKIPSEFFFSSRVIFISNKLVSDIDPAILTRTLKINLSINPAQMFKRMASLIHQGKLGPNEISEYDKIGILNQLIRLYNAGKLTDPNLRTFVAAAELKHSGQDRWFELLRYS